MKAILKGNVLVGILVLFALTFSIPVAKQERVLVSTEWIQNIKKARKSFYFSVNNSVAKKFILLSPDKFILRLLTSIRNTQVQIRQLTFNKRLNFFKVTVYSLKHASTEDDDYLFLK
jgi:hypothetical protein